MPVALVSQILGWPEVASGPGSVAGRRVGARRRFRPTPLSAALVIAVLCALAPSGAAAAACPSLDTSYTGNCGPQFSVPNWTDVGGWTDPSKYSTIQLADVNGDGSDELIGRADDGIEVFWFDTKLGQWRPQVDSGGARQVLTDFATPPPWQASDPHSPAQPQYYSTIQAANVDPQPGEEILARFWDGMRIYSYSGPGGSQDIDGGTWKSVGTGGPFSDAAGYGDASLYSTIHVGYFSSKDFPKLFARQHSQPGDPSLAFYTRDENFAWSRLPDPSKDDGYVSGYSDQECGQPSCYLDLKAANAFGDPFGQRLLADVVGRNGQGVSVFTWDYFNDAWDVMAGGPGVTGAFADVPSSDCPFSTSGASGPGSGDCLGSSPSYYETLGGANLDGQTGDGATHEFCARASDGLRVYTFETDDNPPSLIRLPTLTALAGAPSALQPGQWGSIRTGDIDADGKDEVLALDGKALQAWSYDPAGNAWGQLQPSTPLALAADPWLSHPEYYSTIQTGDVDGDSRDDVVARGPSGIRTWFYDRRGTGGWERYLDGTNWPSCPSCSYPAFPTAGQQFAFAALTGLAKAEQVIPATAASLRDVWASENAPQVSDLAPLLGTGSGGLGTIAGCSGAKPGNPPQYQTCTPPAGSSGFSAADWTAVVNELLSELYAASQVVTFFAQLESMREDLFIAEGAELPAIGLKLGLQAAAGSTTQFNVLKFMSTAFGIAGSVAGAADPVVGAPLSVAAYILSAIPAGSPIANSSFETTYAGLQNQFAQMIGEIDKAMLVQSQQVRQDAGLLDLVGQLRSRGTWALDTTGMQSAANQGFATWVYEALMPTIYDRYQVTNCANNGEGRFCQGPSPGPGVIGNSPNFTTIGLPPTTSSLGLPATPCIYHANTGAYECSYDTNSPPADLMTRIWGPVSATCNYQPGKAQTAWTFGCAAGVDVDTSIGQNSWGFNSHSLNPAIDNAPAQAAVAQGRRRAPIVLGRPRVGHRRAVRGRAYLRADVAIPRSLRLAGANVTLHRLMFERAGHGELTRARGGRAPRPLKLRRTSAGRLAASTTGRRRMRLMVRRVDRRARVALRLRISGPAFRAPRVCHALPAAIALDTPPLELESRLRISDGRTRRLVRLTHPVRCVRDRRGNMSRLVGIRPRRHPTRGGLAVTLRGPRRVRPGTTAGYVARVHNRRSGRDRLRSSLWDVRLLAFRGRRTRISELRAGRSRSLTFTRRVPRTGRRRFCVDVVAAAPGAQPARARVCSPVRTGRAPAVTG